ncbi:MAG: tRNA lysidine(34) synthetase TilS [Treponema sp.]|nr:tRNA lysidine(34) synthetase TilS [Candidatus Treponema merdequi]
MSDDLFSDIVISQVYDCLKRNGYSTENTLCAGVSGGADSICLLTALVELFTELSRRAENNADSVRTENAADAVRSEITDNTRLLSKKIINVITVNHRIRSEKESGGDCEFVKKYSEKLSNDKVTVNCEVVEFSEGEVFNEAQKRGRGIEEAARYLRYKAFEKFAEKSGKVFFATAHNQSDQIETLVMRFLQGASGFSRCGILEKRFSDSENMIYIRPLLNVPRKQIENFLLKRKIDFRTDSTNSDNNYLRNRIRNIIIPVLKENYPGFEKAILSGREKAFFESEYIEKSLGELSWIKKDEEVFFNEEKFYSLDMILRQNLLYKAFDLLGVKSRIPYGFVKEVASGAVNSTLQKDSIEACVSDGNLIIKKQKKNQTNYGFFDIIEMDDFREYDFGTLSVECIKDGFCNLKFVTNDGQIFLLNKIKMPFCFRSRNVSDEVLTNNKDKKSVSDVLSDFKVKAEYKNLIPVIEELEDKKIRVLWGEIFGYKNWIVKD